MQLTHMSWFRGGGRQKIEATSDFLTFYDNSDIIPFPSSDYGK